MPINLSLIRVFCSGLTREVCSQGSFRVVVLDRSLVCVADDSLFHSRSYHFDVLALELAKDTSSRVQISDVRLIRCADVLTSSFYSIVYFVLCCNSVFVVYIVTGFSVAL